MKAGGLNRLLPLACLIAALCLFAAELMTKIELTPPSAPVIDTQTGAERHGYAVALIAAFALTALAFAVFASSKPAATAVAVAGVVALLIFLLVDVPDANAVGTVTGDGGSFLDAQAVPAGGFWLELLGAVALTISGIALATLPPDQLASLRPGKHGRPPTGEREPARKQRPKTKPGRSPTKPRPRKASGSSGSVDAGRSAKRARWITLQRGI
jgi:hypothetical protein